MNDDTILCMICLETIKTDFKQLPCQHIYHKDCFKHMLLNNIIYCPICRKTIDQMLKKNIEQSVSTYLPELEENISNHNLHYIVYLLVPFFFDILLYLLYLRQYCNIQEYSI